MNALLLPGNSPRHAEWIEKLKQAISPYFQHVETQHYRHWHTNTEKADIDYEIKIAKNKMKQYGPFIIIAKSIGTVIAVRGVASGELIPEKLILLGVPIKSDVPKNLFNNWLSKVTIPMTFAQNAHDPLGSFDNLKANLTIMNNTASFIKLSGTTHDYIDFDAIAKLI